MFPRILSLDIESFGILKDREQTTFHPVKSVLIDGISPRKLIVTVAISYRDEGGELCSGLFVWQEGNDREALRQWFRAARRAGSTIVGQNILFDLQYLRYCDVEIRRLTNWNPHGSSIKFDDTMIVSFLDFEERPEKSLKTLSTLFGLESYSSSEVTGQKGNAKSPYDPKLWEYNVKDSAQTLLLYEIIWKRIREAWPASSKLSKTCRYHRNLLIRTGLLMSEYGIHMNWRSLTKMRGEIETKRIEFQKEASPFELILSGKGSRKSQSLLVSRALTMKMRGSSRLERTKVKKEISINKNNILLLLTELPLDSPHRVPCQLLYDFNEIDTLYTSYLKPLTTMPRKGLMSPSNPVAYPSWFLVPMSSQKGRGDVRGTIQGRITCTTPGLQTFPPPIKECVSSRFPGGIIAEVDYRQLELVVAAFLSQDELMLAEWYKRFDRHTLTAHLILNTLGASSDPRENDPQFKSVWRQMGKTLNFLVLYRGGADAFRTTLLKDAGESKNLPLLKVISEKMSLPVCQNIIDNFNERYYQFRGWQDDLIEIACRDGRLELPTGWSRSFPGGAQVIRKTFINEICNFPVQCIAAQLLQSAKWEVCKAIARKRLPILLITQTYDSMTFDLPSKHLENLGGILKKNLTRPPLLDIFNKDMVPVTLEYEMKVR